MNYRKDKLKDPMVGRIGVFLIGLFLGLSVALTAIAQQRAASLLSQRLAPLLRPATITELELKIMQSQISELADHVNGLSENGLDSCCAKYSYDPTNNKMNATFIYPPETFDRLTVQEAQEKLGEAAKSAVAAIMSLPYDPSTGKSATTIEEKDCEVYFLTWNEHAQFKTFAIYKNGQLELIDRGNSGPTAGK